MNDYSAVEGEETDDGELLLYVSGNDDAWIRSNSAEDLDWNR